MESEEALDISVMYRGVEYASGCFPLVKLQLRRRTLTDDGSRDELELVQSVYPEELDLAASCLETISGLFEFGDTGMEPEDLVVELFDKYVSGCEQIALKHVSEAGEDPIYSITFSKVFQKVVLENAHGPYFKVNTRWLDFASEAMTIYELQTGIFLLVIGLACTISLIVWGVCVGRTHNSVGKGLRVWMESLRSPME